MPEGPEVAITADSLRPHLVGATLSDAQILSGRYLKTLPEGWDLLQSCLPATIRSVHSQGKLMYLRVRGADRRSYWIWNTYGMSGRWCLGDEVAPQTRVLWTTTAGQLQYLDTRNFGTFRISTDREALQAKVNRLSPDLLRDTYDTLPFQQSRRPLVRILMDQECCGSGIGNYLVAEILYRARLSPHRPGRDLSDTEVETLVTTIQRTIKLAYLRNSTGYMRGLPACVGGVTHEDHQPQVTLRRGERFQFLVYRRQQDPEGREVVGERIIPGRTTWWVPEVQS